MAIIQGKTKYSKEIMEQKNTTHDIQSVSSDSGNTIQYNTMQISTAPLVASESEALGDSV